MIAKPEWFNRRKYTGWGLVPATKEGWIYIILVILPAIIFNMFEWDNITRAVVSAAWVLFLVIDVTQAMARLKIDEREKRIESISERNAAWAMVLTTSLIIVYEMAINASNQNFNVNPELIIILISGLIAKIVSNIAVEKGKL